MHHVITVLLHLAGETIVQDLSLGLSYLLALPNVSTHLARALAFHHLSQFVLYFVSAIGSLDHATFCLCYVLASKLLDL